MPATNANDKQSDKQPAPGGGLQPAPGGGLQPALDAGTFPPLDAALDDDPPMSPQEFLRRFSSERRLIPLNRLGVHKINRKGKPLNGAQVLSLMMRFRKGSNGGGEDFQHYRYMPARVVEPDPQDLGETERHTNAMAAVDHRIRSVDDATRRGLFGLFSKSHLWSAVWGMSGRCVRESPDPDAPFLEPPTDQPDFAFVEENGLWCEVVSWQGAKRYPKILEARMRSENFDATSALAEDEVTFLSDIHGLVTSGVVAAVGEREYDAVARAILSTPGQTFTAKDVEPRYNLAKVIGIIHVDFLQRYCTLWVDFQIITIPLKALQALCKLPATCPWLKVCLLCDNYMTAEPKTRVNNKGIADNWGPTHIDDILAWNLNEAGLQLEEIEQITAAFLDTYIADNIPKASPELLFKSQCRFVQRVGCVLRGSKRSTWQEELSRYEQTLRSKFVDGELPPPVLKPVQLAAKKDKGQQSAESSQKLGVVDESPALKFDDRGRVQSDMSCKARSQGLAVGTRGFPKADEHATWTQSGALYRIDSGSAGRF